jgi:hypothetical protein
VFNWYADEANNFGHEGNTAFLRAVCSGERRIKVSCEMQIQPESTCGPEVGCYKEVHGS